MVQPLKLVELLRNRKVYIQTHNFPDPDALASAFGLQQFLLYYGVGSTLCYDGKIDKISTKKMLQTFGIEILAKEELNKMTEEDYIVTVDSQKYNANLTDFIGNEVACIDHHPTYIPCEYLYKDVRYVGSCSTLIAEYFKTTKTPLDSNTATALLYGLKMDTADFSRGTKDLDIEMFQYLHHLVDQDKMSTMSSNLMEFEDLKAYGAAIETIQVYDRIGFAVIPFTCPDALVAMVSDFVLALDEVDVAIIYASRGDGLKFSVRSELSYINAGLVTQQALEQYGSGGGHPSMAGGLIPRDNLSMLGRYPGETIRNTFLNAVEEERRKATEECY